jgi:hypothetical protein
MKGKRLQRAKRHKTKHNKEVPRKQHTALSTSCITVPLFLNFLIFSSVKALFTRSSLKEIALGAAVGSAVRLSMPVAVIGMLRAVMAVTAESPSTIRPRLSFVAPRLVVNFMIVVFVGLSV